MTVDAALVVLVVVSSADNMGRRELHRACADAEADYVTDYAERFEQQDSRLRY